MNDRFKFRIWHEPLKQMHYNDFIVTATGYMAKIYQQDDYMMKFNQEDLEFDKQCILMQCTGLKDKHGKLIYEGDIVRFKDNVTIKGSKTHISAVEFNEQFNTYMYHAECMGLYTVNKAQNEQFDVEVIGNIYEIKNYWRAQNVRSRKNV